MPSVDMIKELVLELDADSIVYRVGGAIDMLGGGKKDAEKLLMQTMAGIYRDTECSHCNVYLGSHNNYRKEVAEMLPYKGNRDKNQRPFFYDAIRQALVDRYDAVLVEGQEAEDSVGIAAYAAQGDHDYIIGAIDKDLNMLKGTHYNYANKKTFEVSPEEALIFFYVQIVTGDMTDNIPGLYKQLEMDGEEELAKKFRYSRYKSKLNKEMYELLEKDLTNDELELKFWELVVDTYTQYGQVEAHGLDRILEVARLVWIRRYEGEIWLPPTERNFNYIDK